MEILYIAIILIVGAIIYLAIRQNGNKQLTAVKDLRTADLFNRAKIVQTTPKGMTICGESVTPDVLDAFDAGASKAFAVASECKGYKSKLSHADWSVFVLPSTPSPETKTPSYFHPFPLDENKSNSFRVAGEYLPTAKNNVIAVANPNDQLQFAFEIVYNEMEHSLAHKNNLQDYQKEGTPSHSHPLWSDCRIDPPELTPQGFLKKTVPILCGTNEVKKL